MARRLCQDAGATNRQTVEEALVTTAEVRASNGVTQVVDKVLIPPAR